MIFQQGIDGGEGSQVNEIPANDCKSSGSKFDSCSYDYYRFYLSIIGLLCIGVEVGQPLGDHSICSIAFVQVCVKFCGFLSSICLFISIHSFIHPFIHLRTFDYLCACALCVCCTMCHLINQSGMLLFSAGNFIIIHLVLSHRQNIQSHTQFIFIISISFWPST